MAKSFLIYGANGFVGREAAALAVSQGHRPIVAGRSQAAVEALAAALGLEARVFALDQADSMDRALEGVTAVLHCAGPYQNTFRPMVEGCLRSRVHYLDLTGELSVYLGLMRYDAEAREKGVMILPGAGFDVVPTDCLAAHLHGRLPSATRLTLAFQTRGPRGFPPGTANTFAANLQEPVRVLHDGRVVEANDQTKTRMIDFGRGPRLSSLATWGDLVMAHRSTGITHIEEYLAYSERQRQLLAVRQALRPLFRFRVARRFMRRLVPTGSTAEERATATTSIWGEVIDEAGRTAIARMHGPEAGVVWTTRAALSILAHILAGDAPPGFQTPATAYGFALALEAEGVSWEDVA